MKTNKNILVASMGRTGNNLLTEMIRHIYPNVQYTHFFDQPKLNWSDIVISSKRDFREQMASTKRYLNGLGHGDWSSIIESDGTYKGRKMDIYQECETAFKNYLDWKSHAVCHMKLEDWFTNPKQYIKDVFNALDVPSEQITENLINVIETKFKTPIHPGHITKSSKLINYNDTLSEHEISEVNRFFDEQQKELKDEFLYIEDYG